MRTFKEHLTEVYKDYPGKGWLMDGPDIKPKDIIWRSKVHHWDNTVRSDNTRFIITILSRSMLKRYHLKKMMSRLDKDQFQLKYLFRLFVY